MFSWNYFITSFPIQTHRQQSSILLLEGQEQSKVIIYTNSVAVAFLVLNAKFQNDKTFGTCETIFEKGCYHILAWLQTKSCDLEHLFKHSFPIPHGISPSGFSGVDLCK